MNTDSILAKFTDPAKHHRDRAAYWERVASKARTDGDLWYESDAKAKAAAERQKAREHEARQGDA